jgi:hypothetical protein
MNVRINAGDVEDKAWINDVLNRGGIIEREAEKKEGEILEVTRASVGGE